MINSMLDFAVDHAAVFATTLVAVVVSVAGAALWAYGRYHQRAMRRREAGLIS